MVALGSLGAVVPLSVGWKSAPNTAPLAPNALAIRFAPVLGSIALVLFVIGNRNLKRHIRRTLHHSMPVSVIIWSNTHPLALGVMHSHKWLFGVPVS